MSLPTEGETSTYLPANLDLAARALILVIENALDLSPEGQAVEIQAKNENDKIKIHISDRGRGIPEALKDQIFEPFVQGDSTRTHQGLGIGVHVVRRIMRAHGGTLEVLKRSGAGRIFVLSFPAPLPLTSVEESEEA